MRSLAVVAVLLLPARFARADPEGSGFEAGLRAGYAVPLGKFVDEAGADQRKVIAGAVPFWLDIGYRVLPELFVGAYGQYAFGFIGDQFDGGCDDPRVDCSTHDIRLGLQLHYHPVPKSLANPWVGIGFGYEWLSWSVEAPNGEISFTTHGFELVNLMAGLDFKLADNFYLGPALSFGMAQYTEVGISCSGAAAEDCNDDDPEIENAALHEWLMLSIRGAYAP